MNRIMYTLFVLVMLASDVNPSSANQDAPDEIEEFKHAATVIRLITEYEGPVDEFPSLIRDRLDAVVSALRNDEVDQAELHFSALLDAYKPTGITQEERLDELEELFRMILREAYGRDVGDLRYVADKVRYFDEAIEIARNYIAELGKYREEVGEGEIRITTTEIKQRYAYAESPEALGAVRRLGATGIDAEIERVRRRIVDMEKQVESAVMQLQFATRRKIRIVNNVVAIHDCLYAVLKRRLESAGKDEKQP